MGRLMRVVPHTVMLVVSVTLYWLAARIEADTGGRIGPAVWPRAIIVFMGLLCAYEIAKRLVMKSEFEAKGVVDMGPKDDPLPTHHRMLYSGIALIAAYVFAVPWLGFFLATALFLAIFPWVGGMRRPVVSIVVSLVGTLTLAVVFLKVAYISLPLGEGPFKALSLALMRLIGVT